MRTSEVQRDRELQLHDYQITAYHRLFRKLRTDNEVALAFPTGSGKSLVSALLGSQSIKSNVVKKTLVIAPYISIVDGFTGYSGMSALGSIKNNSRYLIRDIRKSNDVSHSIDLINGSSSEFLVTTHSAFSCDRMRDVVYSKKDFSDLLLIIDEAHHCYESDDEDNRHGTYIGQLSNEIKRKGGKVLYVTATPWRTVNNSNHIIFDPEKCLYAYRTMAEAMNDGEAPTLDTEYAYTGARLENANGGIIEGTRSKFKTEKDNDIYIKEVIKSYKEDGYPKTILQVPAGNSRRDARAAKQKLEKIKFPPEIAKIRGRQHPRVLIAVGKNNTRVEYNGEQISELEYDKQMNGQVYDIIIGCRKFDEGTDVPSASHMYMAGLPSNSRIFYQRVGRILRSKKRIGEYAKYFGKKWLSKSKVTFFAPVGKTTKNFDVQVARQILHCLFAGQYFEEYCKATANANINISFQREYNRSREGSNRDRIDELMSHISSLQAKEYMDYGEIEVDELVKEQLYPNMTIGDRIESIRNSGMSDSDRTVALISLFKHLPKTTQKQIDWDYAVQSLIAKWKRKEKRGFQIAQVVCNEIESILSEFHKVKVVSTMDDSVQRVFTSITGDTYKEWAEKCRSGEDHAIHMCNQVIAWMNDHGGKYPSYSSKNKEEKRLGSWVSDMRNAKNRKRGTFYPILDKIAFDAVYPDLFNNIDYKQKAIDKCNECIKWMNEHDGRFPSQGSKNSEEIILARWMSNMRTAKKGKGNMVFFNIIDKMAVKAMYPDMFDTTDWKKIAIVKCNECIEWMNEHDGKYPSSISKNKEEKNIGQWISVMRSAKNGNGSRVFYPEVDVIAKKAGYPDLFDNIDYKQKATDKCNQVIAWMDQHDGKYPSKSSKNKEDKGLGTWLSTMRRAKKGRMGVFYPVLDKIAKRVKYPNMFNSNWRDDLKKLKK